MYLFIGEYIIKKYYKHKYLFNNMFVLTDIANESCPLRKLIVFQIAQYIYNNHQISNISRTLVNATTTSSFST